MGRFLLLLTGCVCIMLLSLNGFAAEQADEAVLESISYEKDDSNKEKIIFKLNGAHIPKVFKIKGERPRLVFDFLDTRYSDLINRIADTKGSLIQGVRVGIHNDPPKTRVVIDLKPEGEVKFEQDFLIQENTLTIIFHPDEPTAVPAPPPPPPVALTEPVEPKPAQPEPVEPTPAQPEPIEPKPAQPEPVEPKLVQPEPEKPEPMLPEPQVAAAPAPSEKPDPDSVFALEAQPTAVEQSAAVEPTTEPAEPEVEAQAEMVASAVTMQPDEPTPAPAEPKVAEPLDPVDPVLRDVSFETAADNTEMVLFKLNDFYPPIVFGIEKGNPRVVCDFLDTALDSSVRPVIHAKGNYISKVRVARHSSPDKVRVVLDLVPNRNYDLQQVFFKEDNLFIILINEFEEEAVPAAELSTPAAPKS